MEKKKNFIARYFTNFGIKQISEILIFVGLIALIVSLFFIDQVEFAKIFMGVTLGVLALAYALGVIRHVLVITNKKVNRRSPEYKHSITMIVVTGIMFALCLFGCLFALLS